MAAGNFGIEIALFSTANCKYCVSLEAKLKKLGIPYHKYDNVSMPSYPVLGVYDNRKLKEYFYGDQTEEFLKNIKR